MPPNTLEVDRPKGSSSLFTMALALVLAIAVGTYITKSRTTSQQTADDVSQSTDVRNVTDVQRQWKELLHFLHEMGVDTHLMAVRVDPESGKVSVVANGNLTAYSAILTFPLDLQFNSRTMPKDLVTAIQDGLKRLPPTETAGYAQNEELQLFATYFFLLHELFREKEKSMWHPWLATLSKDATSLVDPPDSCLHIKGKELWQQILRQFERFRRTTQLVSAYSDEECRIAYFTTVAGVFNFTGIPTLFPVLSNVDVVTYDTNPSMRPGAVAFVDANGAVRPDLTEETASRRIIDFIATNNMSAGEPLTFRMQPLDPHWAVLVRGIADESFPHHHLWVAWDYDENGKEDPAMASLGCYVNDTANFAFRSGRFHDDVFKCAQLQVLRLSHERLQYDFSDEYVQKSALEFLVNHANLAISNIPESCPSHPQLHRQNVLTRNFFTNFLRRVQEREKRLQDTLKLMETMEKVGPGEPFAQVIDGPEQKEAPSKHDSDQDVGTQQ